MLDFWFILKFSSFFILKGRHIEKQKFKAHAKHDRSLVSKVEFNFHSFAYGLKVKHFDPVFSS